MIREYIKLKILHIYTIYDALLRTRAYIFFLLKNTRKSFSRKPVQYNHTRFCTKYTIDLRFVQYSTVWKKIRKYGCARYWGVSAQFLRYVFRVNIIRRKCDTGWHFTHRISSLIRRQEEVEKFLGKGVFSPSGLTCEVRYRMFVLSTRHTHNPRPTCEFSPTTWTLIFYMKKKILSKLSSYFSSSVVNPFFSWSVAFYSERLLLQKSQNW